MSQINLALDAAVLVMNSGGSTVAANRSLNNILQACEEQQATVAAWRVDFITVTVTEAGKPTTYVRPLGPIGVNLSRASAVALLADRARKGQIDSATLAAELDRLKSLASPYNRWMMLAFAACASASYSRVCGGDWGCFGLALAAALIGQFLRSLLQARNIAEATVTLTCGIVSSFIAAFGLRLGLSQTGPQALISSVFYMVPGLPLINGFFDIVSQKFLLIGIERIASAAFVFLILAVAIELASTVML